MAEIYGRKSKRKSPNNSKNDHTFLQNEASRDLQYHCNCSYHRVRAQFSCRRHEKRKTMTLSCNKHRIFKLSNAQNTNPPVSNKQGKPAYCSVCYLCKEILSAARHRVKQMFSYCAGLNILTGMCIDNPSLVFVLSDKLDCKVDADVLRLNTETSYK